MNSIFPMYFTGGAGMGHAMTNRLSACEDEPT